MLSVRVDRTAPRPSPTARPSPAPGARRPGGRLLLGVLTAAGLLLSAGPPAAAQAPQSQQAAALALPASASGDEAPASVVRREGGFFTFSGHDLHPDLLFSPYTAGTILAQPAVPALQTITAFRELLETYRERQGVDDNFTIRVTDSRTGKLLELYVLEADRAKYEREETAVWDEVDRKRRLATRRLLDKYAAKGIPRGAITAKWGRRNQVLEARRNEEPFIEYEVRLARYLGFSLLATEIGTVETFNQDHLISTAGARGRYQMMPYLLRHHGLNQYRLQTASGGSIAVTEEWHPLLTMEPAFLTLRGYANAVGHELPGLSAYHAGPGNIYKIYRHFLGQRNLYKPSSTVVDAFVWALTDGFSTVSRGSSFGSYSRGYVPAAYGSLRTTEDLPVDTSLTMRTERVRMRSGRDILLSRLLRTLEDRRDRLYLGPYADEASLYEVFRKMNPHLALPEGRGEAVPVRGDVRLVRTAQGKAVRFFLPLGATEALADQQLLDEEAVFRFDPDTYAVREAETEWDRAYAALVQETARFGFTAANRRRLLDLVERFEKLAEENPTHYRLAQLHIIKTHERLWTSEVWEPLARAAAAAAK